MKKIVAYLGVLASVALLSSCAAAWQNVSYSDDLYTIHNKIAIADRQKAEAELAKAQYEAQQAQYEANLARIKAEAAKQGVAVADSSNFNSYDAVLADSYESAYARRLYGFSSPTYRLPSSYYSWRYSDAFHYASAYDPAFYNVMVSGDMVWVEPKYVTSMFGSWGAAVVPTYSWYYGWVSPYDYWYRPYRYWNNPYYYDWSHHYYCGGYYHHYHHKHYWHNNHYRPHRPSHHRPSHHRPPYAGSGSVGNTGHHHNRPGAVVGRNPGASRPVDRGGNSSYRPSQPSGRGSQPTYRSGSSSSSSSSSSSGYGRGSSSYRSGSSGSGSSSYRSGSSSSGSSYRSSGSSSSGSSYRSSGSSSSSSGGSRSYSGGGGNSRGR